MTAYDYGVLAFYFAFMLAMSWVCRRFVRGVSDYFRAGGRVMWWIVGSSAFMVAFSAWTFTGAAGQIYSTGWPVLAIYCGNVAAFLFSAFYFAPRFRQLRVVTSVEAIRQRFGPVSEQVFTWLQIPLGTLQAGIRLNALGVFFSALFGIDLIWTIVATGVVVLLMALVGGSWSVLVSDFIQVLLLMPVCLAVTVLSLLHIGGWAPLVSQLPAAHLDLSAAFSDRALGLWCVAMILKQINATNNLAEATRYLCVKDSRHARRAGILGATLFVLGVAIWFLPPLAARALLPDLGALYPQLQNPPEAAYIAVARAVMPVGMMGLLVSGIFAATMSSMDSGLNKNAGIFIKNFYQRHFRPDATDAQLLTMGKIATALLGVVAIFVALRMSQLKDLSLFVLMQRVSILVSMPVIVPLLLGLLIRRTPPWSAWSTVLVGFLSSLFISDYFSADWAANAFGSGDAMDASTHEYGKQAMQFFGNIAISSAWFISTTLFWRRTPEAQRTQIDSFFRQLNTPVDFATEEGNDSANDRDQHRIMGWLSLAYGAFLVLLALIPNSWLGRLAFVGCGAVGLMVGGCLLRHARQRMR